MYVRTCTYVMAAVLCYVIITIVSLFWFCTVTYIVISTNVPIYLRLCVDSFYFPSTCVRRLVVDRQEAHFLRDHFSIHNSTLLVLPKVLRIVVVFVKITAIFGRENQ